MATKLSRCARNVCKQNSNFLQKSCLRPFSVVFKPTTSEKLLSPNISSNLLNSCSLNRNRPYSEVPSIKTQIDSLVLEKPVVVFMKGTPEQPLCGFSNAVTQILKMHGVPNYDSHNVLENEELRQGIKEYSNWPTIPQVYMGGEFLGGCDILIQMHQSGELIDELKKVGIKSDLAD